MNDAPDGAACELTQAKIYLAGHRGMVGSAIKRALKNFGCNNIIERSHDELDLTERSDVREFFRAEKPDYVVLAAARVGGIKANNDFPAQFIFDNLCIAANVIKSAHEVGVRRLLFLGSSCIYPRHADQPMSEEALLTDKLEPTNEPYAVAKIAGIKLCESFNRQYGMDYRSVMPTNLYGPNDNFDVETSHVLPALIRKFHEAKMSKAPHVEVWGTGRARREFLHVDDLARAALFIMQLPKSDYDSVTDPMRSHLNVGTGDDVSIAELANLVKDVVGFRGQVVYDQSKPDGTPRKLLDVSRMSKLGWRASVSLRQGVESTYVHYCQSIEA